MLYEDCVQKARYAEPEKQMDCAPMRDISPVQVCINDLQKQLSGCHEAIERLGERLRPVLGVTPSGTGKACGASPAGSQMEDMLGNLAEGTRQLREKIATLESSLRI